MAVEYRTSAWVRSRWVSTTSRWVVTPAWKRRRASRRDSRVEITSREVVRMLRLFLSSS